MRRQNINSSLHLPDKTLQFVRDHPLLEDPVLPIGNKPRLITKDVNYTQIVVERVEALDGNTYDIIFTGTGEMMLFIRQSPTLIVLWASVKAFPEVFIYSYPVFSQNRKKTVIFYCIVFLQGGRSSLQIGLRVVGGIVGAEHPAPPSPPCC